MMHDAQEENSFRERRKSLGWSQEWFAHQADVAVRTVQHAEAGRKLRSRIKRRMLDALEHGEAQRQRRAAPG